MTLKSFPFSLHLPVFSFFTSLKFFPVVTLLIVSILSFIFPFSLSFNSLVWTPATLLPRSMRSLVLPPFRSFLSPFSRALPFLSLPRFFPPDARLFLFHLSSLLLIPPSHSSVLLLNFTWLSFSPSLLSLVLPYLSSILIFTIFILPFLLYPP